MLDKKERKAYIVNEIINNSKDIDSLEKAAISAHQKLESQLSEFLNISQEDIEDIKQTVCQ